MALPASLKATDPANVDIKVKQGATFYEEFQFLNAGSAIDLTGVTATAKIKTDFGGSATTIATFSCSIPTPANGTVLVELTPATTAALPETGFSSDTVREATLWYWDLELDDSTDVVRGVQGQVIFSREVTTA